MSSAYRRRLERDLDRWIAAGLVAAERRADILADASRNAGPRVSAATALGVTGAVMLGLAVIAFVMANWDAIPRAVRLGVVIALIWSALAGAAWAGERRPRARDALALLSSLFFAAGVGIVGQMYNLPGAPWQALALSCAGALALGWAATSRSAAIAALVFGVWAYLDARALEAAGPGFGELGLLALGAGAVWIAVRQRSLVLAHLLALYAIGLSALLIEKLTFDDLSLGPIDTPTTPFLMTLLWAGVAYAGWRLQKTRPDLARGGAALTGYGVWTALAAFAIWGLGATAPDGADAFTFVHRIVWLSASIAVLTVGRSLQAGWITAAGVVSAIGAVRVILADLGLDLLQIAGLFFLFALGALAAAFVLGRRRSARP